METPRLVGVGVHTDRGKYGAQMRKGQVRGKLGRDIMALCIMSKCRRSRLAREKLGRDIMALCIMSKCGEMDVWRWIREERGGGSD
jgi:hypothetical protein